MKHYTIGFLGLGLIGGSIARAIKLADPQTTIQVYTRRKNPALDAGVSQGVIDTLLYQLDERLRACDFIFLCAPVLKNIEFLSLIQPLIQKNCIITDVGSVKGNIHKAVAELGMEKNFIGGHPMAGSEKTGYANSSAHLLSNSYYLLTPTPLTTQQQSQALTQLLRCTHSEIVLLSPEDHDNVTAAISHVPHIVAASLVNMVREQDSHHEYMKHFAAGGFRDITRIASSSPEMWENICTANKESIDSFLTIYIQQLKNMQTMIQNDNREGIRQEFEKASAYRDSMTPPSTERFPEES